MPKDGKDNLIPVRSKNEAREKGRKGGVASGEARRKKRDLRETLETLLKSTLKDEEIVSKFEEFGFKKGMTMQDAISAAMIQQAVKGNVKAFVAIRDTIAPTKEEEALRDDRLEIKFVVEDVSGGDDENPSNDS